MQTTLDNWIVEKIGRLDGEINAGQAMTGGLGYLDGRETLSKLEAEREHLRAIAGWYQSTVKEVQALATGPTHSSLRVELRRGLLEDETYTESPLEALIRLSRTHGDLSHRLKTWLKLLIERGQLSPEQAARVDLTEPVNPAQAARIEAERKERRDFEAGFEQLRQAVKAQAEKTGESVAWSERDFLACWNRGRYTRNEAGLLQFAHALGERKLLPVADRFANSIAGILAKVKAAIT